MTSCENRSVCLILGSQRATRGPPIALNISATRSSEMALPPKSPSTLAVVDGGDVFVVKPARIDSSVICILRRLSRPCATSSCLWRLRVSSLLFMLVAEHVQVFA